ncbi:unnamed protein product [Heligmosomoides polygyrus]|uniref:cDNA n=1 Tax=Heligmosomoides polygyrus TaxID=6339 RepID=A0A183G1G2_HELPZ|nr:unnamed protein product [Heligmosomoides polygyrus]
MCSARRLQLDRQRVVHTGPFPATCPCSWDHLSRLELVLEQVLVSEQPLVAQAQFWLSVACDPCHKNGPEAPPARCFRALFTSQQATLFALLSCLFRKQGDCFVWIAGKSPGTPSPGQLSGPVISSSSVSFCLARLLH